ncbi:hypothetical protein HDU83_001097 [Entophlyctis luteolus]|nr:hypothetical protein HDU83_001097 [Entophlyctis luteolus]
MLLGEIVPVFAIAVVGFVCSAIFDKAPALWVQLKYLQKLFTLEATTEKAVIDWRDLAEDAKMSIVHFFMFSRKGTMAIIAWMKDRVVVELKAELFKTKDEFDRIRSASSASSTAHDTASATSAFLETAAASDSAKIKEFKKLNLANKLRTQQLHDARYKPSKDPKDSSRTSAALRRAAASARDDGPDASALEASWVALERKAREYNRLQTDATAALASSDDDGEARNPKTKKPKIGTDDKRPLVDFVRKHLESGSNGVTDAASDTDDDDDPDPWVEATDAFGRTRIMRKSEADSTKREAEIAEIAATMSLPSGSIPGVAFVSATEGDSSAPTALPRPEHFDPTREIRNLGVGYYALSQKDEERKRQLDELNSLRKETEGTRAAVAGGKHPRGADLRMKKLEERKALLRERNARRNTNKGADDGIPGDGDDVDAFLRGFE